MLMIRDREYEFKLKYERYLLWKEGKGRKSTAAFIYRI